MITDLIKAIQDEIPEPVEGESYYSIDSWDHGYNAGLCRAIEIITDLTIDL